MADKLRWFKVWTIINNDPDFEELPLEDLGRWAKLGAYIAEHGTKGRLTVPAEATRLCQMLRCSRDDLKSVIKRLPNVSFEEGKKRDDRISVTWQKWHTYQVDTKAAQRMKTLRLKRRGEERRIRGEDILPPKSPPSLNGWPPEWEPLKQRILTLPFFTKTPEHIAWVADIEWWQTQDEKFSSVPSDLDDLLVAAVAYIETEGYKPRTKAALRRKLFNCMEFEAKKAERRQRAERKEGPGG